MMKAVLVLLVVASASATISSFYGVTPNPSNGVGGQVLSLSGSFGIPLGTEIWRCRYRDVSLGVTIGQVSGTYISFSTVRCPSSAFIGQFYIDLSDDNGINWQTGSFTATATTYCPLTTVGLFVFNVTQPNLYSTKTVFATGTCGNGFWIEGGGQPNRICNTDGTWGPVQDGECTEIPRPIIEYVSPKNLGASGGSVTVYGEGFTTDSDCFFGGVVSSNTNFVNSNTLYCVAPSGSVDSTITVTVQNLGGKESQQVRSMLYTQCSGACPLGSSKSNQVVDQVSSSDGTATRYATVYATDEICSGPSHGTCQSDCTCVCNTGYGHSSLGDKNCDIKLAPSAGSTLSASATLLVAALAVLALAL